MNIAEEVVACALRTQTLRPFLEAGLNQDWFRGLESYSLFDGEDRTAYEYLLRYWDTYRKVPDVAVFRRDFPEGTYELSDRDLTAQELCDAAAKDIQRIIMSEAVSEIAVLINGNGRSVPDAAERFRATARKLDGGIGTPRGRAVDLTDPTFDIEPFLARQVQPGVPMGVSTIDTEFGGWQPGQVVTFLGRQKATKTTSLLHSALTAWESGWNVLFFSVEMDTDLLRQRVYSLGAHVNPERLRRGTLHESDKDHIRDFHSRLVRDHGDPGFIISEQKALLSVDDIEAEIDKHNPHAVYIDGFGFLRDPVTRKSAGTDWQAHENAADQLRALALEKHLPVVVSAQVQEKQHDRKNAGIAGASMQSGGGLLRVSSLVLGFNKDDAGIVNINCVLSRFTPFEDVRLQWDWDVMEMDIVTAAGEPAR